MLGSLIAGWVLFAIGVIMYLVAIWGRLQEMRSQRGEEGVRGLGEIRDTAEAIAELAEAFSKFSENIQFLLLGTGALIAGLYLLANRPF